MLTLIFGVLALAGGICTACFTDTNPWWVLLLVPGYYLGLSALYFICLYFSSLCLKKGRPEKSSAYCRFVTWLTMQFLMQLLNVKVVITGKEKLPQEPCLIASNHRSDFDPMTALSVLKERKLIYISKEANFKIPIVGRYITRSGYYAIDRENGMRALRTLKDAAERMKSEGLDVGIYPEGTRSKTGELLEFKTGTFYLAKKAEAPVVLMTTVGTEKLRPVLGSTVRLDILEVIDKETVLSKTSEELTEYARSVIANHLSELEGPRS